MFPVYAYLRNVFHYGTDYLDKNFRCILQSFLKNVWTAVQKEPRIIFNSTYNNIKFLI